MVRAQRKHVFLCGLGAYLCTAIQWAPEDWGNFRVTGKRGKKSPKVEMLLIVHTEEALCILLLFILLCIVLYRINN